VALACHLLCCLQLLEQCPAASVVCGGL